MRLSGRSGAAHAALHSAAIIRTRIAEQALIDGDDIDAQLNALSDSIRRSLACSPADPFLWFVLYWVESNRNGFQADYLKLLTALLPIRTKRRLDRSQTQRLCACRFQATAAGSRRDGDLAEFAKLLDSGFYGETVAIFTGPGWRERALLFHA